MSDMQDWAKLILAWPAVPAMSYNEYLKQVTNWMNGASEHPLEKYGIGMDWRNKS